MEKRGKESVNINSQIKTENISEKRKYCIEATDLRSRTRAIQAEKLKKWRIMNLFKESYTN